MNTADLLKMVFIDIETIAAYEHFGEVPEPLKSSFMKSFRNHENPDFDDLWKRWAPLKSECNEIIAFSFGTLKLENGVYRTKILKSAESDKPLVMASTLQKLADTVNNTGGFFAGHNILNFDLPTITRKLMAAGLAVPINMMLYGMKPWDMPHKDTMTIWGQSVYGYKASLESLCHVFGIDTPKAMLSGDKVSEHYYAATNKKDALKDIGEYCMKDNAATMTLMCRLYGVQPENIFIEI